MFLSKNPASCSVDSGIQPPRPIRWNRSCGRDSAGPGISLLGADGTVSSTLPILAATWTSSRRVGQEGNQHGFIRVVRASVRQPIIKDGELVNVLCGFDVGRPNHYPATLNRSDMKSIDWTLPKDETASRVSPRVRRDGCSGWQWAALRPSSPFESETVPEALGSMAEVAGIWPASCGKRKPPTAGSNSGHALRAQCDLPRETPRRPTDPVHEYPLDLGTDTGPV